MHANAFCVRINLILCFVRRFSGHIKEINIRLKIMGRDVICVPPPSFVFPVTNITDMVPSKKKKKKKPRLK